jgi:hypothetical protein
VSDATLQRASRATLIVALAVVVQLVGALTTMVLPLPGSRFGLPLPIGRISFLLLDSSSSGAELLGGFAIDIALTVIGLWVVQRFAGTAAVVAASVAVLVQLWLTVWMWQQLPGGLGFAGIPVPVLTGVLGPVDRWWLSFDCAVWAALAALATAGVRRGRAMQ